MGGDAYCIGADGLQHEWLFDVSNPSSPTRRHAGCRPSQVTAPYNGVQRHRRTVNYWAYYYRPTRRASTSSRRARGKFNGSYFYRAARSIFDIHKLTRDVPPSADFTCRARRDLSRHAGDVHRHLDGLADELALDVRGRHPASSTVQSPLVTFATEGSKSVSLTASNSQGPSTVTKSIIVLSPAPQIAGITVSPANPLVCQPVTFTATGVTGQPTLGL